MKMWEAAGIDDVDKVFATSFYGRNKTIYGSMRKTIITIFGIVNSVYGRMITIYRVYRKKG